MTPGLDKERQIGLSDAACLSSGVSIDEQEAAPTTESDDLIEDSPDLPGDERNVPGPWRASDGTPVPFPEAKAEWARVAHDVLVKTAKRYNDYVTYSELADRVLDESGIQYRAHQRNWIGKVLAVVAERNATEGEPPLTALCVSSGDEKVGAGYAYVLKLMGQPKPKDLQPHAAESRLECYRFYGADLPPGGGVPTPTRAVAAKRARIEPPVEKPVVLCPVHFSQLPLSGQCDLCD
jgi:hypothetical protein